MSGFVKVQFKAGERLFSAGDPADKLYVIEEGSVQLLDGKTGQPFATLVQGESFGEQAVLAHGVRGATAVAQGEVRPMSTRCSPVTRCWPASRRS